MKPRPAKVAMMAERSEDEIKQIVLMRTNRLYRLVELGAPDFIIAIEHRMANEAIAALFMKRGFDPTTDPRVTQAWSDPQ